MVAEGLSWHELLSVAWQSACAMEALCGSVRRTVLWYVSCLHCTRLCMLRVHGWALPTVCNIDGSYGIQLDLQVGCQYFPGACVKWNGALHGVALTFAHAPACKMMLQQLYAIKSCTRHIMACIGCDSALPSVFKGRGLCDVKRHGNVQHPNRL